MRCVRIKHSARVGFAQPGRDHWPLGAPEASATSTPGRRVVALSRAGWRGRGPQRRASILQNKSSGPALDWETPTPPPSRLRRAEPSPSLKPSGAAGSRLHARSQTSGAPANHRARGPESHGYSKLLPNQTHHPRTLCIIFYYFPSSQSCHVLMTGRGPHGAHVWSRWGRGEGAAGLCCK